MKIVRLRAENIKRLVAVEITPKGDVIKISGKNNAGKSSVLDAIWWALGGQEAIQGQPIRKGQTNAKVEIDLDEIIVRRTFSEKGTSLVIENKDGLRFKSPQGLLDGLLGRLSFDPLAFMRQKPAEQFEVLKMLTGLDLSKLDGLRNRTYQERAAVNQQIKRLEVQVADVHVPPGAPTEEVAIAEIATEIDTARRAERNRDYLSSQLRAFTQQGEHILNEIKNNEQLCKDQVDEVHAQIAALQNKITKINESFEKWKQGKQAEFEVARKDVENTAKQIKALVFPDIAGLQKQLAEVEEKNKAARAYQARESLKADLTESQEKAKELTEKIKAIDAEKQKKIGTTKFPIDGLAFGDGTVIYKDIPLEQAGSAEQLKVSMAMAMAMNPKLKVIRIMDGSLLDSDSMKIIEEMAKGKEFQVWVEQVDESGKVGVVIEDGQVKTVNE